MITVRLDSELEARIEAVAKDQGLTVSAFVRRALEKEVERTQSRLASQMLAPYVGAACSDERTDATKVKEIYRAGVREKAAKWKER